MSIHSPEETGFTDQLAQPAPFPARELEPAAGIEPATSPIPTGRTANRARRAAERSRIERRTRRCLRFSKPFGEPTPVRSKVAER